MVRIGMEMPWSIYVHVPFCRVRCGYCAFNVFTDRGHLVDAYVDAVRQEIRWLGRTAHSIRRAVHSIYFGGGTPSLLSPAHIKKILTTIGDEFAVAHDVEISLEANPGTVGLAYLQAIRQAGVARLSLGMQSVHEAELALFGRLHRHEDVVETVNHARRAGFDNLSLDLIYGNPHQTRQMWQTTLAAALALAPENVSYYALEFKSGTEMARQVRYGELPMPEADLAADMYEDASEKLARAGFVQYEISNWGLPGKACRHNLQYWRNLPYLGLGAGAHGYAERLRTVNAMRPEVYIQRLNAQQTALNFPRTGATIKAEEIDIETDMFETIFMGLRLLQEGLSLVDFERRYGLRLDERFGEEIAELKAWGLLWQDGERLKLTPRARLVSNSIFQKFIGDG